MASEVNLDSYENNSENVMASEIVNSDSYVNNSESVNSSEIINVNDSMKISTDLVEKTISTKKLTAKGRPSEKIDDQLVYQKE